MKSALRDAQKRLLAPDAEALGRAQASTWRAGPHPVAEAEIFIAVREALKAMRIVSFHYRREDGSSAARNVAPYGLLYGSAYYLVGAQAGKPEPVLWRLDRMSHVKITDRPGAPPKDFDIWSFKARSFGAYQEEAQDIELRFSPDVAEAARRFLFHPSQSVLVNEDRSVTICFRVGGLGTRLALLYLGNPAR